MTEFYPLVINAAVSFFFFCCRTLICVFIIKAFSNIEFMQLLCNFFASELCEANYFFNIQLVKMCFKIQCKKNCKKKKEKDRCKKNSMGQKNGVKMLCKKKKKKNQWKKNGVENVQKNFHRLNFCFYTKCLCF